MSTEVLKIDNLSKNFGSIKAVDQLSASIEKGSVYGILGPNGSGKTTTLGIILSVVNQSSGGFKWFGNEPSKEDRKKIGAIIETPNFYPYLSGLKNLQIVADIKGCSYDEIPALLEKVNLTDRQKSKFKTYSLGMKQRLAIAAALIGNPEVLILDEPTNGLDPQGIAEIRNLIIDIAKEGITIVLASHLLDEVQKVCTHVAVLEKGKKLFEGEVKDILNSSEQIEIAASDMQKLEEVLKSSNLVSDFKQANEIFIAQLKKDADSQALSKTMFEQGIAITHLSVSKNSLENYFLELLEKKND